MSISQMRNDLTPGLAGWLKNHQDLEGDISVNFHKQEMTLQVYNKATKKLITKKLTLPDIEGGKFPSIVQKAIKEALPDEG